jgi:hypothetical protein
MPQRKPWPMLSKEEDVVDDEDRQTIGEVDLGLELSLISLPRWRYTSGLGRSCIRYVGGVVS